MTGEESRPIGEEERSGVLHPGNLSRYDAHWIAPIPDVSAVVDQYWHVSWALGDQERVDQRIIDLPAVTATIEDGDVPAPLVLTGVQTRAWRRTIHGHGQVFAIRLRPAGLAVVSDVTVDAVADRTVPLTEALDPRLYALMSVVAREPTPVGRARAADDAIRQMLAERAPTEAGLLANRILDELRAHVRSRTGADFVQRFGISERTALRSLKTTLGHGPKWVSRRIRLQEVAFALAARPDNSLAAIAAELDYSDQSHLTDDFRSVSGITPGAYRRGLAQLRSD